MRSAQRSNRKTDIIISAAVLTQWQTQLVHTIKNNIIIIMCILGVFYYLTVKTMYLSKPLKYQTRENPNSDFYCIPQWEMSGWPDGDPCKITQNTGSIPGSGQYTHLAKDHRDLCL